MQSTAFFDRYPTRKWPEQVLEHEPAHGYFTRLADECAAQSARVFADSLCINGRNFQLQEILDLSLMYPVKNIDQLRETTPLLKGSSAYLYGEKFRRQRDWSMQYPRVCPACLAESRHYRNWWDLWIVGTCPFHRIPLIRGTGSDLLDWRYPGVGITQSGTLIRCDLSKRYSEYPITWENYVLGRIGVLPRFANSAIDQFDMALLSEVAEVLGRIGEAGWARRAPHRAKRDSDRRRLQLQIGFEALSNGIEGVRKCARRYFDSAPNDVIADGMDTYNRYGWCQCALECLSKVGLKSMIITAFDLELGSNLPLPKRRKYLLPSDEITHTLNDFAKKIGVTARKFRELVVKLQLVNAAQSRNQRYAITPAIAEKVKQAIAELLAVQEASQYLGTTENDLTIMREAGLVAPFIRWGQGAAWPNRYRRSELDGLLNSLREKMAPVGTTAGMLLGEYCAITGLAQGEVIVCAYRGRLQIVGWSDADPSVNGMVVAVTDEVQRALSRRLRPKRSTNENHMLQVDVAATLNLSFQAVEALLARGLLKRAAVNGQRLVAIDAESVRLFQSTYTTIGECARAVGKPVAEVVRSLADAGIHPLRGGGIGKKLFVERAAAERVLATHLTTKPADDSLPAALWDALRHGFSEVKSTIRVFADPNSYTAKLRAGNWMSAAEVELDPALRAVTLKIESSAKGSRRLYRSIRMKEEELKAVWPTAIWQCGEDGERLTVSEILFLDETAHSRLTEISEWVQRRMTAFHAALLDTQNPKLARKCASRKAKPMIGGLASTG